MDVSAEAADLVVREGLQATEAAAKLTGDALKNVAALLLAVGYFLYHEAIPWNRLVGVGICLVGLVFINYK